MCKVVLFIVETFHRQLLDFDFNATLRFFSDLKSDPVLLRSLDGPRFKNFVAHLIFDQAEFDDFESKHQAINAALNFEPVAPSPPPALV